MFFSAYTFKGQVHVFAGWLKNVSHLSCRTSAILKYFLSPAFIVCSLCLLVLLGSLYRNQYGPRSDCSLGAVWPGRVAQSVTCLATDASLTADPGVASSIPARSHTFVEIDHEIISTVILLLPLNHSWRVVVSYKRKYVHEVLVNCLFKLAQEKVWLGELTVPQWP